MTKLITKVAGVTYEGRQEIIAILRGNEPCRIVPEPENPFDPNALAVHVATNPGVINPTQSHHVSTIKHVGYIPRNLAAQIAPHLEGEAIMVKIHEITGGFKMWNGSTAAYGLVIEVDIPGDEESVL